MINLEYAKNALEEKKYTCCAFKNEKEIFSSFEKGIKPLYTLLKEDENRIKNAYLADKLIGKASAFLIVKAGAKAAYTELISEPALEVLEKYNILIEYKKLVPNIKNNDKSDICPMEKLVLNIDTSEDAFLAIDNLFK